MPLAPELADRYLGLFREYGTGGNDLVVSLKGNIAERRSILREDAMYFLLVNLDHMLIRALSGYVPSGDGKPVGLPLQPYADPGKAGEIARQCLGIIEDELAQRRKGGERSSANDVARAIVNRSDDISQIALWWRE